MRMATKYVILIFFEAVLRISGNSTGAPKGHTVPWPQHDRESCVHFKKNQMNSFFLGHGAVCEALVPVWHQAMASNLNLKAQLLIQSKYFMKIEDRAKNDASVFGFFQNISFRWVQLQSRLGARLMSASSVQEERRSRDSFSRSCHIYTIQSNIQFV